MANGILIIDKPAGWTSMDVCAKVRGILREKRVGHGGTLDPMATGVLPVFVGRATRAVEFAAASHNTDVDGLERGGGTSTQERFWRPGPGQLDGRSWKRLWPPSEGRFSRFLPCTPP